MEELTAQYRHLLNVQLPARYTHPVCYNHCFNRIILDWLFDDCWYNHLQRSKTALSQLTPFQLERAVSRMNAWLLDQQLLIADNNRSLGFRKVRHGKQTGLF